MKQFAKAVSIFAGVIILIMTGFFVARAVFHRSAQADANMRALMQADTENGAASAVFGGADGALVEIPDSIVITEEYIPPRDSIPLGAGAAGQSAPDAADAAQTAKYLYDAAAEFLAQPRYADAVRAQLEGAAAGRLVLDTDSDGLAQSFFGEYLGVKEYAAQFAGCRVSFFLKDGQAAVEFASGASGDTAAAYAAHTAHGDAADITTEVTEVTMLSGLKKTVVTTTVVTTRTSAGSDVQYSVSSRTEAN